ncbi:LysM peptidoglycan-binding domain-containing protein, partial [bacterium]|nr:LysM peptidoglycan-binding domain-containing protein [bacterium]
MKKIYALLLLLLLICSVGRADVLQLKDGVYIIKEGDCLWNISKKYYDNPYLWPKIWEANPYITNPDLIFPDDQLVIPGVDAAVEEVETEMNETIVETPVEEEVLVKEETPVVVEPIKVEEETEVVVEDEAPYEDEAF